MIWIVRTLIFALLATTGVVPLPWAHSHQGMLQSELQQHREQFHLAQSSETMPQGWHWHFYGSRQVRSYAVLPSNDPFAVIGSQVVETSADLTTSPLAESFERESWKLLAETRAAFGPKIYLRLLVLRN